MRASVQDVLRGIAHTLTDQVLPELEQASWTASNIRACAMLLLYLEDRVTLERSVLIETNTLMREFLCRCADEQLGPASDPAIAENICASLAAHAATGAAASIEALTEANETYKLAMQRAARRAAELRKATDLPPTDTFRALLHECLAQLQDREGALTLRANQHVPL